MGTVIYLVTLALDSMTKVQGNSVRALTGLGVRGRSLVYYLQVLKLFLKPFSFPGPDSHQVLSAFLFNFYFLVAEINLRAFYVLGKFL